MIIATAGHVDHGKTLLVKALTGVDTDRLPEEKKRGMTIDLGFAYLPVASNQTLGFNETPGFKETIGFVDVPGHERFVHNMLAGVAGIDFVLFIVAADDGPMPQTREHLAILDLLGVKMGAVALTKIDRVPRARVDAVRDEITALFSRTSLADSPVIPVSAMTGEGIEGLKTHLAATARNNQPRPAKGNFRMAIDRCFSVSGAGLIVTGTAVAGSVETGETVRVLHAGLTVRARTIHAQNAASASGKVGQRCALNLADRTHFDAEQIENRQMFPRLRVLAEELRPLAHWTPVHVHIGASDVTGRVAVLEGSSIAPGASALAQIVLDRPMGTLYGDGLIIRDQSAQRTIGGGKVIDIFPPVRGRARPDRLTYLQAMDHEDEKAALVALLNAESAAASGGLNLKKFAQNRNLTATEAMQLFASVPMKRVATPLGDLGFTPQDWDRIKARVIEALSVLHRRAPNTIPNEGRLFLDAGIRSPKEVAAAVITELSKEGVVVRVPSGVRLHAHVPQLNPADAAVWKKAEALFKENPLRPPTVHDIAVALAQNPAKTESFLVRVSRVGLLARVAENRFILQSGLRQYARLVEESVSANGSVAAAALRDRAGVGRTLAIEVLEYFDRIKFTRRIGDEHQVVRPAREVFGEE